MIHGFGAPLLPVPNHFRIREVYSTSACAQGTIAKEERAFYLASPFLIRYLTRCRLTEVLIGCIIGAPILRAIVILRETRSPEPAIRIDAGPRDALAIGMLLAIAWRSNESLDRGAHTACSCLSRNPGRRCSCDNE